MLGIPMGERNAASLTSLFMDPTTKEIAKLKSNQKKNTKS